MSDYRRVFLKGGTFFFTVVTYKRYPIFKEEWAIHLLKLCFQTIIKTHPFRVNAIVVLPDHLHTIWTLPDNEFDFSTRWKLIKGMFSRNYSAPKSKAVSNSMRVRGEQGIWQRRFWEHAICDEDDFECHCDYIHYNPVKHGLVNAPIEWEHSSFRSFVEKGMYDVDWGQTVSKELVDMDFE